MISIKSTSQYSRRISVLGGIFLVIVGFVFASAPIWCVQASTEVGEPNPAITDQTGPRISFNGLRHLARVRDQITLTVVASGDSGVTRVELYVDGVLVLTRNVSPVLQDANITFVWNSSAVANGKHMLTAKAYDQAGGVGSDTLVVLTTNFSDATPTPTPTATVTPTPTPVPSGNNIVLNAAVRYQTMNGWEATAEGGQYYSAAWPNYKNTLLDQAVNDLGINRLRVEIPSGAENPVDYFAQFRAGQITESQYNSKQFEIINDNSDPNSTSPTGFQWTKIDSDFDQLVIPMRQRLQARGESLWISICYVDFGSSSFEHKNSPAEYAEFVLAVYKHIQSKYGITPDSWEVILEPDTSAASWTSTQVAQAAKAAGDRLVANGFTPNFVAPSTTDTSNAVAYIAQLAANGAIPYVGQFSYHRYTGVSTAALQGIASQTLQYGKTSGMLEWIGADYSTLHDDLKIVQNSQWQQYTLGGPTSWGPDTGDRYYIIDDSNPNSPVMSIGSRTKFLRQYFKFIRRGAQRIDAQTTTGSFDPVAFINSNGKYVVVVKAANNGSFNIQGLPAAVYGIKFTTSGQYDVDLADYTVSSGQLLTTSIPGPGVITIYAR